MKPQEPTVATRSRFERHKIAARPHETTLHTHTRNRIDREVEHDFKPELELVPPIATSHTELDAAPVAPVQKKEPKKVAKTKVPMAPCHWGLLVAALVLSAVSVPLVYSASTAIALDQHGGDPNFFLSRQLMNVVFGIVMMVFVSRLDTRKVRGFVWTLYMVAVAGLLLTKFSPLGFAMGNVERWVKLGPVTFQFSELAKIALIGVMADYWKLSVRRSQKTMRPWGWAAGIAGVPFVLTFIQPHLSAALVLAAIPFVVAFCAGVPTAHFKKILLPIVGLGIITVFMCKTHSVPFLATYQQDRIAAKLSGGDDEQGGNYQQLQGERAIVRGGPAGVGLGASLYKQGHLPAPHTDFIFAVIAEETGLWGAVLLVGLYGAIVFFCFQIGHSSNDRFAKLLCSGVGALWALQALGNIGVVSGVLPVTGMPLPVLTYGGSGLWCALLGVGLVLSVSRTHCQEN
ncbi:cell division protein FtsW [bacterium]|nr:MAG: cell division protein FtsW [bacterium]